MKGDAYKIAMTVLTDMNYWEDLIGSSQLMEEVKKHLLEKISVIIKLHNFLHFNNDPMYVSYITENVVSISEHLSVPEKGFNIDLIDWNSEIIDRETTELIITDYISKNEFAPLGDCLNKLQYRDRYFISLPHFPFIEIITKSDLLNLIEKLLVCIENRLTPKEMI